MARLGGKVFQEEPSELSRVSQAVIDTAQQHVLERDPHAATAVVVVIVQLEPPGKGSQRQGLNSLAFLDTSLEHGDPATQVFSTGIHHRGKGIRRIDRHDGSPEHVGRSVKRNGETVRGRLSPKL